MVERYKQEFTLPCYKNFVQNMNNFAKTLIKIIKLFGLINIKTKMDLIIDASALPVCHIKREKRHKMLDFPIFTLYQLFSMKKWLKSYIFIKNRKV